MKVIHAVAGVLGAAAAGLALAAPASADSQDEGGSTFGCSGGCQLRLQGDNGAVVDKEALKAVAKDFVEDNFGLPVIDEAGQAELEAADRPIFFNQYVREAASPIGYITEAVTGVDLGAQEEAGLPGYIGSLFWDYTSRAEPPDPPLPPVDDSPEAESTVRANIRGALGGNATKAPSVLDNISEAVGGGRIREALTGTPGGGLGDRLTGGLGDGLGSRLGGGGRGLGGFGR